MASVSLYRKWRPQRFADLKGQDVIRDTLFYALTEGQISQAYLFCGPRGTGKTTTARLVAKLVNCQGQGEKPCNACMSCVSITEGTNLDILEVDAASNRGIDEIRQLRDSVRFAPTSATYKVFIIDEVHMLTREAFNALLKTLEEPPSHALFILATTESHKIPPTIASRCQRYDFHLASEATLVEHLLHVAKDEDMALTPEAAQFIARLGEGSFRDSLSLLDQVRSAKHDTYTLEVVESLFGYIPRQQIAACLTAVLTGDAATAHTLIDAALAQGALLAAFCAQLLLLSQQCLELAAMGQLQGSDPELFQASQSVGLRGLVAWIELLLEAMNQMKQSPIARLPLDVAIAKYALQGKNTPARAIAEPKEVKPVAYAAPLAVTQPTPGAKKEEIAVEGSALASLPVTVITEALSSRETVTVPVAVTMPEAIQSEDWEKCLQALKSDAPSLVTTLAHAKVMEVDQGAVKVAVRFKMHAEKINQPKNRQKIESVLANVLQAPLKIEAHVVKDLVVEEEVADVSEIFDFEE